MGEHKANMITLSPVDEGRKRVLGIMAAILASLHMQTADDLFGGPQGSPRSESTGSDRKLLKLRDTDGYLKRFQ